jgi:hypothetical protein
VNGSLNNVSVFPDPIKTGTESLLAKIFNVFVMLGLSPLQPRDLGLGQDVDCDALIASIQKRDPHGIVLKDFNQTVGTKGNSEQSSNRAITRERDTMS